MVRNTALISDAVYDAAVADLGYNVHPRRHSQQHLYLSLLLALKVFWLVDRSRGVDARGSNYRGCGTAVPDPDAES